MLTKNLRAPSEVFAQKKAPLSGAFEKSLLCRGCNFRLLLGRLQSRESPRSPPRIPFTVSSDRVTLTRPMRLQGECYAVDQPDLGLHHHLLSDVQNSRIAQ